VSKPEEAGVGAPPRAVLDTSVLMSAHRHWLWLLARQGEYVGYWSPFIINELVRIRVETALRHDTPRVIYRQRINTLIHALSDVLLVADYRKVDATGTLNDPDDEPQVAAALAVDAHYIVSLNERDFPKGRTVRDIRFVLPQEFLTELTMRHIGRILP
jgi:predicted nucleic acid-binding protein